MSDHGSHASRPVEKMRGMATRSSKSTERRLAEIFQQKYDGRAQGTMSVDSSLESLGELAASIQAHRSATVEAYEILRDTCPLVQETRRQVDTCTVVTTMLVEQVNQRWAGLNLDDASVERQQRRLRSAGGSVFTSMSSAKAPEGSRHSYISQTSSAIRLQGYSLVWVPM